MKILIGYRGKERSLLQLGIKFANAFKAEVLVVTLLVGEDCKDQKIILEAEQQLDYAKAFLTEQGIKCETYLLARGQTEGEGLIAFASEKGVEEIIIGVKKRSKVGKLIFGSTAQHVILNSTCPVTTMLYG